MVIPSVGRRNISSLASAADLETLAVEMVSNTLVRVGIGPLGMPGERLARSSISPQPPQPGITPTPHSTRPI